MRIGALPNEMFEVGYLDSGYRLLRDGIEPLSQNALLELSYRLISDFGMRIAECPQPLRREQRPFCLGAQAEGDFDNAASLIPTDWPEERRAVWRNRLTLIRDNEHLHRIEQPVYKRRWDERWKVGGRWQCGQPAYDAEFLDAVHW